MKFKLNIPEPCHEDWQQMSPTQKGKFCDSCQKEVIDFTKLSSTEIARKTKNATQLCGRFTQSQLKQEYVSTSQNRLNRLGIALGLGSIVAIAQPGFAQKKNAKEVKVQTQKDYQLQGEVALGTQVKDSITIKGTVTDEENMPLPIAHVILKETDLGTYTDFDGFFEIRIPSNSFDKEVILVFSAIGMETKELKIDKLTKEINIDLASDIDNLEGVVVGGAFAYRPNIFQRFLNLFRSKENKRY
ncbi:carboxypeptidase-like regulatory domain-containing protein [Mesonia oceanica]|uniref:TonB-dependent receptor SusC n=1 Tax=Mesonia oceanica TaxID=2687242 RepID=A0AC61YB75_9FLAO|nr:carboxypeptidase-like regulatory domain-containing protein [Mesonia oceanica]VVV01393.1 TonB-dependent receptor SusC [Mesonia oceanica]